MKDSTQFLIFGAISLSCYFAIGDYSLTSPNNLTLLNTLFAALAFRDSRIKERGSL